MDYQAIKNRYLKKIKALPKGPLRDYREQGIKAFSDWGLPQPKWEDWRYSSLDSYLPEDLSLLSRSSSGPVGGTDHLESGVVFVDGFFRGDLTCLPEGVSSFVNKPRISREISRKDSFEALNMAVLDSVMTLEVAKDLAVSNPICITHLTTSSEKDRFMSPHVEIVALPGSRLSILELFIHSGSGASYQHNSITKIDLQEGASVAYTKVVVESFRALHVGKLQAFLASKAQLQSGVVSLSGELVRNNLEVYLNGNESEADVYGLYALTGKSHHDSFSTMNHLCSHTSSRQLFKGILADESRGVFTGKIVVGRECPKVDSRLLNKNLLLSPKAKVNSRPQLEVYTDDVQCAHGATTGQLSEEERFYLESRGVKREEAERILCHAFAGEVLDKIPHVLVKDRVVRLVREHFGSGDLLWA